jgi:hypothetical protein
MNAEENNRHGEQGGNLRAVEVIVEGHAAPSMVERQTDWLLTDDSQIPHHPRLANRRKGMRRLMGTANSRLLRAFGRVPARWIKRFAPTATK